MKHLRRLITTAATAALMFLGACGDDFDPKSTIVGVRVLGVKVETPYAKPGTKPKLSMLLLDGSGNRGTRPVNVVWFHGCTNPPGDLFHQCYPQLSQILAQTFAGRATPIDKEIPGVITLGTETEANIPADALTSRPPAPTGVFPQGRAFVFFVACGGQVVYDPSPPNSSGLPVRCIDPRSGGADLGAEEFVYGYTPLFVFDQLTNANPVIEGQTIGGAPPATVTCEAGCPVDHACSGNRCLPVVPICTKATANDCPPVPFKPNVLQTSAEPDPISSALDKKETRESLWVEYAALNGQFQSGTRVVNDPNRGWNEEYEGKYVTFKAVPGEATLFAVVRDNRGGQAFTSIRVLVR